MQQVHNNRSNPIFAARDHRTVTFGGLPFTAWLAIPGKLEIVCSFLFDKTSQDG